MHNYLVLASQIIISQILKDHDDSISYAEIMNGITLEDVSSSLRKKYNNYSEHYFRNFIESFFLKSETFSFRNELNFFEVLSWLSLSLVEYQNNRFVYKYSYSDIWRNLITSVDEEIMVICAVLLTDKKSSHKRIRYDWDPCISSNNVVLNSILNRDNGVSENHFHLRGSSLFSYVSWIYMMNDVYSSYISGNLKKMEKRRLNSEYSEKNISFILMWKKAAAIRLYFYSLCIDQKIEFRRYFISSDVFYSDFRDHINDSDFRKDAVFYNVSHDYLENNRKDDIIVLRDIEKLYIKYDKKVIFDYRWRKCTEDALADILMTDSDELFPSADVQRIIDTFSFSYHKDSADYAHPDTYCENVRYSLITGERFIIYRMMEHAESDSFTAYMLLLYLNYKNKIRNEMIQSNNLKGYVNFMNYQDRKDDLVMKNNRNEKQMARFTIEALLNGPKMFRTELRITPGQTVKKLVEKIRMYDEAIKEAVDNFNFTADRYSEKADSAAFRDHYSADQFFYTIHFVKTGDPYFRKRKESFECRHFALRKSIENEMRNILHVRKYNQDIAIRIRGIDACNDEMNCRPEVFGRVFREILNTVPEDNLSNYVRSVKATYHVAEDNYDIVDALRAIDEVIRFLGLNSGCRLGHATLLGIDVKKYYKVFNNHVSMPKQNLLDNIVWMLNFIQERNLHFTGDSAVKSFLAEKAEILFNEIYGCRINNDYIDYYLSQSDTKRIGENYNFNILSYYESWKLRGDDPELYGNPFVRKRGEFVDSLNYKYNNIVPELEEIRNRTEPVFLYHMYHYDQDVKEKGDEPITADIPDIIIDAIEKVQKEMRRKVFETGLYIETNPSSNLFISNISGYSEHPVTAFYNRGMNSDDDEVQLNVSVNTDDKTIFGTNLFNEYALLAFYLENLKDENGAHVYKPYMVYDWIDSIRKMGNEQSFGYEIVQNFPC